jgi:hypothetical protein
MIHVKLKRMSPDAKSVNAAFCCLMLAVALVGGCSSSEETTNEKSTSRKVGATTKRIDSKRAFAMGTSVEIGQKQVETRVDFLDEWAVVDLDNSDEDKITVFNLKTQGWYNPRTGYIDLTAARRWAEVSEKASRENMEKGDSPPEVKKLMMETLEPKFTATESEGGLRLESPAFQYELSGRVDLPAERFEKVLAFAKLHAYYKAMTDGKLTPNVELALFTELERRAFLPARTRVTIHNPGLTVAIKMRTQIRPANERDIPKMERRTAAWRDRFPTSASTDSAGG